MTTNRKIPLQGHQERFNMYSYKDAVKYVDKEFSDWSVEQILLFIKNDYWELSRDKIDVQRLNHKAMVNLALEKL